MKSSTLLLHLFAILATSTTAQVTYKDPAFICPSSQGHAIQQQAYCAGSSGHTNVIIRCQDAVGIANLCSNAVEPNAPGYEICVESSTAAGDARCVLLSELDLFAESGVKNEPSDLRPRRVITGRETTAGFNSSSSIGGYNATTVVESAGSVGLVSKATVTAYTFITSASPIFYLTGDIVTAAATLPATMTVTAKPTTVVAAGFATYTSAAGERSGGKGLRQKGWGCMVVAAALLCAI